MGLNDRITNAGKIRNALPIHLAVAAGALGAALHGVSGDGARGKLVPIVACPAELMQDWPKNQPGIGAAAGDHDLCALT